MGPSQFVFSWHSPHENKYNFMSENKGAPYGEKFFMECSPLPMCVIKKCLRIWSNFGIHPLFLILNKNITLIT